MQLASHGARLVARKASKTARSIHIPSAVRPQSTDLGQRLLTQGRIALTRFVTHLTAPGTGTVSVTRSFHAANPSIQQRLSFVARQTLARPLQPRFLPRGPMLPRTMTQVGLGTARNFSSGRPIFQQLADNVPIVGRAFYEADWELNMHKEQENMRRLAKKAAAPKQCSKEMLKTAPKPMKAEAAKRTAPTVAAELEHYFPAPTVPAVTTRLLVPLAPAAEPATRASARAPLPEFPPRLPLPALLAIHDTHSTHALRVSSLFQRLDDADVWTRGAQCTAYASEPGGAAGAQCTVLEVSFVGWSAAAVRGVIGESGTGWCVLEESETEQDADEEETFSETSSILSGLDVGVDPARSLVLPTLDFSTASPVYARSNGSGSNVWDSTPFVDPPSENGWFESRLENPWLHSESDSDSGSDGWLDSEVHSDVHSDGWLDAAASEPSWLAFSADFGRRSGITPEPLESAFA